MSATVSAPDKLKRGGVYTIELHGMAPAGGERVTVESPEGVSVVEEHADGLEREPGGGWVATESDATLVVAVSSLAMDKSRNVHIKVEGPEGETTERDIAVEFAEDDAKFMRAKPSSTGDSDT